MHFAARVITLCFLAFLSLAAFADSLTGKVAKMVDGDTLYVLDANYKQHKIRLAGIDAPERKQAYRLASRKHLASIVAGKRVAIEYQKRDRYGRIVGKVLVDGVDACLKQVKAGFAWHFIEIPARAKPGGQTALCGSRKSGTRRKTRIVARE